jgi:hypothetical protein
LELNREIMQQAERCGLDFANRWQPEVIPRDAPRVND